MGTVHKGITCDGCSVSPIIGCRYKCLQCHDLDFCETCYKEKNYGIGENAHKPDHPMQTILLCYRQTTDRVCFEKFTCPYCNVKDFALPDFIRHILQHKIGNIWPLHCSICLAFPKFRVHLHQKHGSLVDHIIKEHMDLVYLSNMQNDKFERSIEETPTIQPKNSFVDFNSNNTSHDRVLIVGGEEFYIQTGFLAFWSPYFDRMFNSGFKEAKMDSIKLEDVSANDFRDFLNQLLPNKENINVRNVSTLWNLADRFDIVHVVNECVEVLCDFKELSSDQFSIFDRIELAYRYSCPKLLNACMSELGMTELRLKFYKENSGNIKSMKMEDQLDLTHRLLDIIL